MTLTTRQVKVFSWLLGVWFVLSGSAFYLLGRQHGRASATISAASGQTVDGGASAAITVQYDARSFYAVSSTAWEIY